MLRYLLEKEFKQFLRNNFLPKLVVVLPFVALIVFPLVANLDVKNLALAVIDHDKSSFSRQMVEKIASSGYFKINNYFDNSDNALLSIEKNQSDLMLEIPLHFEHDLMREQSANVMIASNAVNGMKGGLGAAYLSGIIAGFNENICAGLQPVDSQFMPSDFEIRPLFRFNSRLDYLLFVLPALMTMMLAIICGFLPALNIVGEKENGTIEQINVTPVKKSTFILSKLIPYWTAGFLVLNICMFVVWLFYGFIPKSSIFLIYLFAIVFVLAFSGFGLVVSNYAKNIQQAMFIMFFFVLAFIFLSGLYTPFNNMPQWAQFLGNASPLKYFIQVLRMTYLKGTDFVNMLHLFLPLCGLATFFNGWAILSYRKRT
jgi:ABC-2 type transport system permease protein